MKCRLEFFASILISSVLVSSLPAVTDSPPVVIGTSNTSLATAWNNARKIERTSDDIRLVVYHDSLADGPVVMWTASADGVEWSEPASLGKGEFPALAIDEEDRFYAAWADADSPAVHIVTFQRDPSGVGILADEPVRVSMPLPAGFSLRHVSLEASGSGLHMAAEMIPAGSTRSTLYYAMFDKSDFSVLHTEPFNEDFEAGGFDRSRFSARRPMISGDLEFHPGTLMIVWTDESSTPDSNEIGILQLAGTDPPDWLRSRPPSVGDPHFPQELKGHSNPSVSYRTSGDAGIGEVFLACSDAMNEKLSFGSSHVPLYDGKDLRTASYGVRGNAMPSVDDIPAYYMSCAVLWQDHGKITYGQAEDSAFVNVPAGVGEETGSRQSNPSVCYRTFRGGLFDAVWTEGDHPPYRILYRRMRKCYASNPIRILTTAVPRAALGMPYFATIESHGGGGGYWPSMEIISGGLPHGIDLRYNGCLSGSAEEPGSFPFTLRVTDYPRATSDTADFVLVVQKNTPHRLTSPETLHVERGSRFDFTPTVSDSESNSITFRWTVVPHWLQLFNNNQLIGRVPADAGDTLFTVIADDGEFADTLTVRIHIVPTVVTDKPAGSLIPVEYSLSPNFPNPFNPTTTVRFALPVPGKVRLDLIGLNGELKKRVIEGTLNAGSHSATVDGADLPSGTYLIRLTTDGWSAVRKCVLLK